jgi:hypothetical protein
MDLDRRGGTGTTTSTANDGTYYRTGQRPPRISDRPEPGSPTTTTTGSASTTTATCGNTTQADFLGLGHALNRMGHTMYNTWALEAELSLQRETMEGNSAVQARFKDFVVNYGQLRVYGAILGDQKNITMIHTLGTFSSLKQATNVYQGKVLGFIGDRCATKEPTPICLPQTKAWQWFKGLASNDRDPFVAHFADPENYGRA